MSDVSLSSGIGSLDELIGGLMRGDNVVWISERAVRYERIEHSFLQSAPSRSALVVATTQSELRRVADAGLDVLDATSGSLHGRPAGLTGELERRLATPDPLCVVLDGLETLARRWGAERALAFFARMCPMMLQAGALTYWRVPRSVGPSFIEGMRQITQCLFELRDDHLHVTKAEGRPSAVQGSVHRVDLSERSVELVADPAAGRLARGLIAIRKDLGLTQAQLAQAAGVTPSAISQAESGRRGLSLDTMIVLSGELGVSLDRLVGAPSEPGYRLARFDRARSQMGMVALADDAQVGMRAYLVSLDGGATGTPALVHSGVQMVAVLTGLVQVETGGDTPVLRSGDCLLVDTSRITRWRNLRPETATLYWMLRD